MAIFIVVRRNRRPIRPTSQVCNGGSAETGRNYSALSADYYQLSVVRIQSWYEPQAVTGADFYLSYTLTLRLKSVAEHSIGTLSPCGTSIVVLPAEFEPLTVATAFCIHD